MTFHIAQKTMGEGEKIHFEQLFGLLRHYSTLRFRQLTIYVAVNGGLLFAMLRQDAALQPVHIAAIATLGVVAALSFSLLEVRTHRLQDRCKTLIAAYEDSLTIAHPFCSTEARGWLVRGRLAVILFIAAAAGFWVALATILLFAHAFPGLG